MTLAMTATSVPSTQRAYLVPRKRSQIIEPNKIKPPATMRIFSAMGR